MQAQAMMTLIPAAGQVTRHAWLPNDGTDSFLTWPALTEELNEEMPNKVRFCTAYLLWPAWLRLLLPKSKLHKAQVAPCPARQHGLRQCPLLSNR